MGNTNAYMTIFSWKKFLLFSRAGQSESLWISAGRPPRLMSVCLIYHSRRKALTSSSWKLRSINPVDQIWFQLEFSVTPPQNSPLYFLPFSNNLTIQELCHLLGSLPTFVHLLKGLQSCPLKKLQTSVSNIPWHISRHLSTNRIIFQHQHSFRRGLSCETTHHCHLRMGISPEHPRSNRCYISRLRKSFWFCPSWAAFT